MVRALILAEAFEDVENGAALAELVLAAPALAREA
jgi:hypothetical protein